MKPHLRELVSTELFALLRAALGAFARQKLVELSFDDEEPVASPATSGCSTSC
jgi:hypothetical protein